MDNIFNSKMLNLDNKKMSLEDNHKKVLEIFNSFNGLLKDDFDCFYTGGLMFFIQSGGVLKRYHNDLDIFVNEDQLFELKHIIDENENFEFVSNMYKKEVNGHEYKVKYKDFPISIGLFLFKRKENGGIITKKYYYDDLPNMNELCVDERHFNSSYSQLVFNNNVLYYSKLPYKMVSPEFIYYSKLNMKPRRDKDFYDMAYVQDEIDISLVKAIDNEKQKKVDIMHKRIDDSIVIDIEKDIVNKRRVR